MSAVHPGDDAMPLMYAVTLQFEVEVRHAISSMQVVKYSLCLRHISKWSGFQMQVVKVHVHTPFHLF